MNTEQLIKKYQNQIKQLEYNLDTAEKNKEYQWLDAFRMPYAIKIELIKKFITDLKQLATESKKETEDAAKNNPDNRYIVTIKDYDKEEQLQCYLYDGMYHNPKGQPIHEDWIVSVEKIK